MSAIIGKRILSVDDDEEILTIVQVVLEMIEGWSVTTAGSGREGLLKAQAEQPDAILLDIVMPGMDGIETVQALQANSATRNIPVIFLTAEDCLAVQQQAKQLGVKAIIGKPFDTLALAEQIVEALDWNAQMYNKQNFRLQKQL